MVIKHRGRRYKRSSAKGNGVVAIKPINPEIHSPSQVRPNKQKDEDLKVSACLNGSISSVVYSIELLGL